MVIYSATEVGRLRHQRVLAYLFGGALLCCVSFLDMAQRGWDWRLFAVRLGWSALVLSGAAIFRWGSDRAARLCEIPIAALSPTLFFIAAALGGGADNPHLPLVLAVPLGAAVLQQGNVAAVLVACVATTVGMAVFALVYGLTQPLFTALIYTVIICALSAYAAWSFRRARKKELAELEMREAALARVNELERAQAQNERLAAVGQLAAGVAHEINNPLAYVRANLAWIREELFARGLCEQEMAEVLRDSELGCERMKQIVSELKQFARVEVPELQPCHLNEVVEEAVRVAKARLPHLPEITRELPAALPPIHAERRRLVQSVANLLVNAADALAQLRPDGPPHIRVRAAVENGGVVLDVEDNGPGLPAHLLPRLFEPFFTTKPVGSGTGLSLALSREFIQRAGGTLTAAERPGGGARFTMWLPQEMPAAPPHGSTQVPRAA